MACQEVVCAFLSIFIFIASPIFCRVPPTVRVVAYSVTESDVPCPSSVGLRSCKEDMRKGTLNMTLNMTSLQGSVFLEKEQDVHEAFRLSVDTLKARHLLNETEVEFDIQYASPHDYFHLYTRTCVELEYGVVTLFGPTDPGLDRQLGSISKSLGIPLISTAPRTLAEKKRRFSFSEEVMTSSDLTLALYPTQTQLVNLMKEFAAELKWKDISIIHDPMHGLIDPSILAEALQTLGTVSVHQASTDLRATLVQLRLKGARNIIIDTGLANVGNVIQATLDTGMMTKSYSYIFTMLDMKAANWSRLQYSEALVFGFNIIDERKLKDFQDLFTSSVASASASSTTRRLPETARVAMTLDSVELLARGLESFDNSGTDLATPSSTTCSTEKKWDVGEELKDVYGSVYFDGMTGPIGFTNGARSRVKLDILKLAFEVTEGDQIGTSFIQVGNWTEGISYERDGLQMNDRTVLSNEKPTINKTLIITTAEGSPCVTRAEPGQEEGYCVELAQHLSKLVGFHYKMKLVSDGRYGKPDPLTGQWDGMIGEVIRGEADMALADLTVTAARQSVVDFTAPFMHTSLGILYKTTDIPTDGIATLLGPFSIWVWVSIVMAFFLTSICLRFVAWLSPYQKDDIILPGSERGSSLGQDLSWINAMWLLASTMVLRGCDIRLSAASSRTIATVWWLFSLVILIIYASLVSHWFDASYPSTTGGQGSPESIENLLKNPVLEFGVVQSGSTNFFLQNAKRETLQKIWWRVQKGAENRGFQTSVMAGVNEVLQSQGRFAFITEEMNLNQALVEDCSLGMISGIDVRSFALAVPKGSPLREKVSQAILQLGENGVLHQLEEKWWPKPNCNDVDGGKPQVQLMNFAGPLTILMVGVMFAIIVAIIERVLHHRRSHRGFFRTATEPGNGKIAMNGCDSESN